MAQACRRNADDHVVRINRLVIGDGERHFTLALHPRLTVITGLGPLEREALAAELVGALGHGRPQVHLEVTDDHDRDLALYRPAHGPSRVVDVAAATDVSGEFGAGDGRVDLWAACGVDPQRAARLLRLTASEVANDSHSDAVVQRLADLDQAELWALAAVVRVTDEQLQAQAGVSGSLAADAQLVERVERRHAELEMATGSSRGTLRRLHAIAVLAGALALVTLLRHPLFAMPGLVVALLAVVVALRVRHRTVRAETAVREALDDAGADSYLSFHLHRVSGILREDQSRRELLDLARDAREAAARWAAVVGDVTLDWALEHQEEIRATARIRDDLQMTETLSGTSPHVEEGRAADLAHALVARLAKLRHLAADGESFPLLLDEPFAEISPAMKPALLELLLRSAGSPQLIFLTADEEIASWARVEMLTGELTVVELRRTPIAA